MEVKTSKISEHNILSIKGEVDALSALELDKKFNELVEENNLSILVDCHDLTYISSAGLGVFMSHLKQLEEKNKKLVIYSLSPEVYSTFEILGLHHIITIEENLEKALEKC